MLNGGAAGWLRSTFARPELASKFYGILNGIDTQACYFVAHVLLNEYCQVWMAAVLDVGAAEASPTASQVCLPRMP